MFYLTLAILLHTKCAKKNLEKNAPLKLAKWQHFRLFSHHQRTNQPFYFLFKSNRCKFIFTNVVYSRFQSCWLPQANAKLLPFSNCVWHIREVILLWTPFFVCAPNVPFRLPVRSLLMKTKAICSEMRKKMRINKLWQIGRTSERKTEWNQTKKKNCFRKKCRQRAHTIYTQNMRWNWKIFNLKFCRKMYSMFMGSHCLFECLLLLGLRTLTIWYSVNSIHLTIGDL